LPNRVDEEDRPDLRDILLVAWENGMVPILPGSLPAGREVKAIAKTAIGLSAVVEDGAREAKQKWMRLVRDCQKAPQEALGEFRDGWASLGAGTSGSVVSSTAYVLQFTAGTQEVAYPALVIRGIGVG
jgi:hypothetical protein